MIYTVEDVSTVSQPAEPAVLKREAEFIWNP